MVKIRKTRKVRGGATTSNELSNLISVDLLYSCLKGVRISKEIDEHNQKLDKFIGEKIIDYRKKMIERLKLKMSLNSNISKELFFDTLFVDCKKLLKTLLNELSELDPMVVTIPKILLKEIDMLSRIIRLFELAQLS